MENIKELEKVARDYAFTKGLVGAFNVNGEYITCREVNSIREEILKEHGNKISNYDVNNFESDFDNLITKRIKLLTDQSYDKLKHTDPSDDLYTRFKPYYDFRCLFVWLQDVPESDYIACPAKLFDGDDKIEEKDVKIEFQLVENSFSDLLLKKSWQFGILGLPNVMLFSIDNVFRIKNKKFTMTEKPYYMLGIQIEPAPFRNIIKEKIENE